MTIRTRFAPSPTGRLHLGNARIAVFNWLLARRYGGDFIVRIEDTDLERNVEGSEETVLEDLRWLGLEWDEGPDVGGSYAPYRQSGRAELYARAARRLVDSGHAYRCYCTEEELRHRSEEVGHGKVTRYTGYCRALAPEAAAELEAEGRAWTVRFAVPDGVTDIEIEDAVRGPITFPASDLTDFIMMRQDGRPTYNFAVVVDDAAMRITHVVRGAGHLSNTPRQALLYDALGEERPLFAHLPTVLDPDGGKLSKRAGATSLEELRAEGLHPEGVVNYLSLLGWSAPDEREILDRAELIDRISLDRVGASDTAYDPEKLRWLSGRHIAEMELDALVRAVRPHVDPERHPLDEEELSAAVYVLRSRLSTFGEFGDLLDTFLFPTREALEAAREEVIEDPEAARVVQEVLRRLEEEETWESTSLGEVVREAGKALSVRGRALFHPVRKVLTASESGPDLGGIMAALGRRRVLDRLRRALAVG